MKPIARAASFFSLLAIFIAACVPAHAYIYSGKRKKVNCGVVMLDNYNGLGEAGFKEICKLFYWLDYRIDFKPPGWSFENPLAPGSPSLGLGKDNPYYWTVNIAALGSLTNMHVLYLPGAGRIQLADEDREKLRQFLDNGGVLWIDNASTSNPLDFQGSFIIPGFKFQAVVAGGVDTPVLPPNHPLLTLPFQLTPNLVAQLGATPGQADCSPGDWFSANQPPLTFDTLYAVVRNSSSGRPSVAANSFGSGRIVSTSNFVGKGAFQNASSLQFAYNVVAWSASWTHLRKDPRHTGYSIDTIGGSGLLESWSFLAAPQPGLDIAPVIYKNLVFYSAGSTLYALDVWPTEDLDYDGNPDDGFQGTGGLPDTGQDLVWSWTGDGSLSAPTIVTAQNPNDPTASIEAVMVMSSSGTVFMLPAFPLPLPKNPGEIGPILTWSTGAAFSGGSSGNQGPYPPLYVNGWIYALSGDGRLKAYNPSLEAWGAMPGRDPVFPRWEMPGALSTANTPKAGPAFGWVKNESNGAMIGVVYWAGKGYPDATNRVLIQNDWIYGVPVFVSNDKLRVERRNPSHTLLECRTALSRTAMSASPQPIVRVTADGASIQVVKVYPNRKLDASASAVLPAEAAGYVVVETAGAVPANADILATYAIDYAPQHVSTTGQPPIRRWLEPVSQWDGTGAPTIPGSPPATYVVGNLALGPDNMIFVCGERTAGSGGCSVYGLENDGTAHSCRWNYQLHSGIQAGAVLAGSPVDIPPVVFDRAGRPLRNPRVYGSPAVAGNKVFVAVSGDPPAGDPDAPTAAILCFKAKADFTIRITEQAGFDSNGNPVRRPKVLRDATGRQLTVRIWQPNLMPNTGGPPEAPPPTGATQVTTNLNMIDYDKGTITFETFDRPKLRGGPGIESNTFTPSLPVWVYLENMPVPVDFTTWAPANRMALITGNSITKPIGDSVDLSGWNNLLWYYIVPPHKLPGKNNPCAGIRSSPVVIGNTVYFVCDDGLLHAIPAEPAESAGGPIKTDEIATPVRVCGGMGRLSTSPAGSNGVLLIPGSDGLHAFTNESTLVADSGRVMEIDGAGEATWSIDTISWPASIPTQTSNAPMMSGPVNKPARAKYIGPGEILLVNTGANQVCKIDKSGVAGWERIPGNKGGYIRWMFDKFTDPKRLLRPGQPTELLGPTDAILWREYDNNVLVTHCLVADSGNHRVLDLVYRQDNNGLVLTGSAGPDPNSGFYLPELNWVSATESMNERYVYESIQVVPNRGGGQDIWAAVSNYRTGTGWDSHSAGAQGLGGAIVALSYRVPTAGSNPGWNYAAPGSGQIVAACDRVNWSGTVRPLAQPKHFQVIDRQAGRFIIICDNYGAYEIGPLATAGSAPPVVVRSVGKEYESLVRPAAADCDNSDAQIPGLGVPLMARCVQELRSGNWLITNGYSGAAAGASSRFDGEVFEVAWDPVNKTAIDAIKWNAPRIYVDCVYKPDGTVAGTDPTTWRQKSRTTYALRQPTSAFRQF